MVGNKSTKLLFDCAKWKLMAPKNPHSINNIVAVVTDLVVLSETLWVSVCCLFTTH